MVENQKTPAEQDISNIRSRFNKAVGRRQWSMIREKIVPIAALPVITTGAAYTTLLGIWDHLPPQAQQIGVMAAGGLCAATTAFSLAEAFFREGKSPRVTRDDAILAMDKDIGSKIKPASKMSDKSADNKESAKKLFEHDQKKIWKKWSAELEDQPFKTGFAPHYKDQGHKAGLHASILLATALTAAVYGDGAFEKFNDALHWQPPPEPLIYQAWITPPDKIEQAEGYLPEMIESAIEQNRPITAHEGSVLVITTQDRPGNITINGEHVQPEENTAPSRGGNNAADVIFQYIIPFDGNHENMNIGIEDYTLSVTINIDNPPSLQIEGIITDPENPSSNDIEYTLNDDYGVIGADLETGVRGEDGKLRPSRLPSAQLPVIQAPHQDTPQGPGLD